MTTPLPAIVPDAGRALARFYHPIARDLEEVERILERELASSVPYVCELVAHLAHYRGKRLRPALLLLTGRACGPIRREHHMLAAVMEMIHTATLVHDDVLDQAVIRRHVATINCKWGTPSSVLLGDLVFTRAFCLANSTGSILACQVIGKATNRVCEGELRQIGESGNLDLTEENYYQIIRGKTAELMACCCWLGAWLSGASEAVVESLARYGRELGMAFQIADDLLDLVGQEEETGKSLGTDLDQQKLTLPLIYLLQNADPDLGHRLRQTLVSSENHKRARLRRQLEESGALRYASRQAEKFAAAARQELFCLPPSEARQLLEELTHRVVHRSA